MKGEPLKFRCPICFTRMVAPTFEILETKAARHACRPVRDLRRLEPELLLAVQMRQLSVAAAWTIHDTKRAKQ